MQQTKSYGPTLREYLFSVEKIEISKHQVELLVKQYNNFEMPISQRFKEIIDNPTEFVKFVKDKNYIHL